MENTQKIVTPKEIFNFWFEELKSEDWFKKSDELDEEVRRRFF